MAAKPAAADTEEFVSVVWCTTLGIPEDVANKLVAARWRVAGLTEDKSKFEKLLQQAGCLAGDIDAAWRKWQAASVDAQRKVVVAGGGTAVQPSDCNEHTPPRDLRAAEPELKPSPARSSAPSSSVESNKTPSKQDWQDFVTESLLVSRVQVDRAAQVSQSHKPFLQELVTACTKAVAAPRDWTFTFKSEDSRKAFKKKILQRVDNCDGCNEATWGIKVFTPVLMRMFGKEFDVSAEENIPLLATTGTFRADFVLGQRLSDKTSEEFCLFHSSDLTNRPGTRCVGLPVQAEYKRSQIGSDEATNRRKLGCQLLLAMEHQEAVLESLKVSPALLSYLKLPWAIGLLMDNRGVTFCYMSQASDAGKRVYFNIALKWATEFDEILRGLAVVRDYVHLFWDMVLHLVHHAAALPPPEPAWRSPLLARRTPALIQDPAKTPPPKRQQLPC